MKPLHFRPMLPEDLKAVMAMEQSANAWPWSHTALAQSLEAGHYCLLCHEADSSGPVLGYTVASSVLDEVSLLNICVAIPVQGQGIGRSLLQKLIDDFRKENSASVWLEVRESNLRARQLYESLGFARQGIRRGYYPAGTVREDAWLYSLSLTESPAS